MPTPETMTSRSHISSTDSTPTESAYGFFLTNTVRIYKLFIVKVIAVWYIEHVKFLLCFLFNAEYCQIIVFMFKENVLHSWGKIITNYSVITECFKILSRTYNIFQERSIFVLCDNYFIYKFYQVVNKHFDKAWSNLHRLFHL